MKPLSRTLVWFRRDLRDFDHAALHAALRDSSAAYCVFVFDREILDPLADRADRRVEFIRDSASDLDAALRAAGGALIVRHGFARDAIPELAQAARCRCRVRQPRLRTASDRPRRGGRTSAGRTGSPLAHLQGPGRLRARRGAFPGRRTFLGIHAVQARVAADATTRRISRRTRSMRMYDRWRCRRPASICHCRRWKALGFARTNLRALGITPGMRGGVRRFADFLERIDDYHASARLSLREGAVVPLGRPAFRHGVGTPARGLCACKIAAARRRRRRDMALRAHLARILCTDPVASPSRRRLRVSSRVRRAAVSQRPRSVRTLVRRHDRISDRRRGDAPAQPDRLHAQSPAHDRGELPGQGSARRLALGRALLRRKAQRLRPRVQQWRLAMGGVDRMRRAAVFSHFQPGDAVGALRCQGRVHSPLRPRAR